MKLIDMWRAGAVKELDPGHPTGGGLFGGWSLSRLHMPTNVDTREVGDGLGNSIVDNCLEVLIEAVIEAPIVHETEEEDGPRTDSMHPAVQLLKRPNPYMAGWQLWAYQLAMEAAAGNGYFYKQRNAIGQVIELWPLLPQHIEPQDWTGRLATEEDVAEKPYIAYYEYQPGGTPKRLEREDVIHIPTTKWDRENPRKGRALLDSVLREIVGDEEAGQFSTSLLKNLGVPGVVLVPKDPLDPGPSPTEADEMASVWQQRFGGRNRGKPYVQRSGSFDVNIVSFTPEQMQFDMLRRLPEERVAGALRVPPVLAHLGAGLDRATYSNVEGLREYFTETTIASRWMRYGASLTNDLLSEWVPSPAERLKFDISDVRALQEDENDLWSRTDTAVANGWITVAEGKRAVGLEADDADEVYLRPSSMMEVRVGESGIDRLQAFVEGAAAASSSELQA